MDNEAILKQRQFNDGQARVNYELVRVDTRMIEAFNALIAILTTLKGDRASSPPLKQMDLASLITAVRAATDVSGHVASIDPPGCQGPYPN